MIAAGLFEVPRQGCAPTPNRASSSRKWRRRESQAVTEPLSIVEILGLAGSISLLSGWRLYLCVLGTGLAMHFGLLPLPENLESLRVLANPWVIGVAAFAALCEFFADKVAWLDSIWDTVHTLVRPVGGALLALAILDPSDPATQAIAFILGSGASLLAHGGKAGTRVVVNASPEPFTNAAVSATEDLFTGGLLYLVYLYPVTAVFIAAVLLVLAIGLLVVARWLLERLFGQRKESARSATGE